MAAAGSVALLAACSAGPGPSAPPSAPASPATSAIPAGPGAASAQASRRARYGIPDFAPAPPPQPITLPAGDSVEYLRRIPTDQKVAFLTIDDGYLKTPEAPELIAAAGVPVTLFLTTDAIKDDPAYFRPMVDAGAVIEAHTVTHAGLRGRSYDFQRREICDSADRLGAWFLRRPTLFRPPFGEKDATTLRAAKDCGMTAAFMWTETVHKGKVRYQEGKTVQPGDIILMHFREAFRDDFVAALKAIHRAGLTPALLEDYVPPQRTAAPPDAAGGLTGQAGPGPSRTSVPGLRTASGTAGRRERAHVRPPRRRRAWRFS
ncbi:polysaccharide deacetylase family protein [Actinoplanes sp. NEAU-A12]|uniref:Polysaccharide deacetylase family protein n=1 Tax=Actinoplanes sandaracinus TaxID=3045177 RepID=A0ABT6WGY8_9ACTN|nr:polysaccharide deacetylase family protein [Actinoplanes sandaracinus]MDI6098980.1 polysaccharide deacetylase family protein [Actinoplanes sandaracinus]